ncbi:MAG TPA: glucosaminidase domain-containing protein [Bacteroidales bacterium]|nr:glucosaminidase domain-containing protein [Bacteroidales bacterium]
MSRNGIYLSFIVLISALWSCSVKKPATTIPVLNGLAGDYIETYKDLAMSEMRRTGIPASITLAQGIIESDYGRSRLATEANNHFGIKCHSDWSGPTIKHHDDRRNECFRKYRKPEESYYDHSDFLTSTSRYRFLFELDQKDYKGWAKGLKKAGYATNPDYANMLIRNIEENELWRYDLGRNSSSGKSLKPDNSKAAKNETVNRPPDNSAQQNNDSFVVPGHISRIKEKNRIQYILTIENDTRESIEKEFKLLRWELSKYNELDNDFTVVAGMILYLQPKRDKAEPGKETHVVNSGDSMYSISQQYGLKLKKLYEMNRMEEGSEPKEGERLWLRSMKPVN